MTKTGIRNHFMKSTLTIQIQIGVFGGAAMLTLSSLLSFLLLNHVCWTSLASLAHQVVDVVLQILWGKISTN